MVGAGRRQGGINLGGFRGEKKEGSGGPEGGENKKMREGGKESFFLPPPTELKLNPFKKNPCGSEFVRKTLNQCLSLLFPSLPFSYYVHSILFLVTCVE